MRSVQHPLAERAALGAMIWELIVLGVAVAAFRWFDIGFELSLLLLLVLGFSLNTLNVIGAAASTSVHLAEIRDILLARAKNSD